MTTAAPAVPWPIALDSGQLRGLFETFQLECSPRSPVAALVAAGGAASTPDAPAGVDPAALRRALVALAAPRQIVMLTPREGLGVQPMGFLNDGETIVRFDVGAGGCLLSAPHDLLEFASLIDLTLGERPTVLPEPEYVGRRFLEMVLALREAGLADGHPLDRASAEGAITPVLPDTAVAADVLEALAQDGVISIEGDRVERVAAWWDGHGHLLEPPLLVIEAIELADAAAGLTRPRSFRLLADGLRFVYTPMARPPAEGDTLIGISPASWEAVAEATALLVAPPVSPPRDPQVDAQDAAPAWLDDLAGAPTPQTDDASPWRRDAAEAIQPVLNQVPDDVPPCLFAPDTTIEVVRASATAAEAETTVFAVAGEDGVEWAPVGSLIRWRRLRADALPGRLAAVIPAVEAAPDGPGGWEVPMTAIGPTGGAGEALPLSGPHAAVLADPHTIWLTIRAQRASGGTIRGEVLLLAHGTGDTLWRLEPHEDRYRVTRATRGEVLGDLAAALR